MIPYSYLQWTRWWIRFLVDRLSDQFAIYRFPINQRLLQQSLDLYRKIELRPDKDHSIALRDAIVLAKKLKKLVAKEREEAEEYFFDASGNMKLEFVEGGLAEEKMEYINNVRKAERLLAQFVDHTHAVLARRSNSSTDVERTPNVYEGGRWRRGRERPVYPGIAVHKDFPYPSVPLPKYFLIFDIHGMNNEETIRWYLDKIEESFDLGLDFDDFDVPSQLARGVSDYFGLQRVYFVAEKLQTFLTNGERTVHYSHSGRRGVVTLSNFSLVEEDAGIQTEYPWPDWEEVIRRAIWRQALKNIPYSDFYMQRMQPEYPISHATIDPRRWSRLSRESADVSQYILPAQLRIKKHFKTIPQKPWTIEPEEPQE